MTRSPRLVIAALVVTTMLGACAGAPAPSAEASRDAVASVATTPSSVASGSASTPELIAPGQPLGAADVLAAMRGSLRPGGVPDVLESETVAAAVAAAIWTFDGAPYDDVAVGGSCGPDRCALELVGVREDSTGEDLWLFTVDTATESVVLTSAELGAIPEGVLGELDALARRLAPDGTLDDLVLASARWSPPTENATFLLAYRSGNEEGSCAIDLVLDAVRGDIIDVITTDC